MAHFLTVKRPSKAARDKAEKLSLSCGDLSTIEPAMYDEYDVKRRSRKFFKDTWPSRLLRPSLRPKLRSMDRIKSKSSEELSNRRQAGEVVDTFDSQLAKIKEKLAMFREQDMEFRERMKSLSISIDELSSRSSPPPSEVSTTSDPTISNDDDIDDDELSYTEDQTIENKIKNMSAMSFSTEVLNSIPTITITCQLAAHQVRTSNIIQVDTVSEQHSIGSGDCVGGIGTYTNVNK